MYQLQQFARQTVYCSSPIIFFLPSATFQAVRRKTCVHLPLLTCLTETTLRKGPPNLRVHYARITAFSVPCLGYGNGEWDAVIPIPADDEADFLHHRTQTRTRIHMFFIQSLTGQCFPTDEVVAAWSSPQAKQASWFLTSNYTAVLHIPLWRTVKFVFISVVYFPQWIQSQERNKFIPKTNYLQCNEEGRC